MEELEKGLKELRGFAVSWREQWYQQTRPPPQSSRGLDHHPKNIHGVTHKAGHLCVRGYPCWTSVGVEALGPEGVRCPSVGECQGGRTGVSRCVSNLTEAGGSRRGLGDSEGETLIRENICNINK